MADLAPRRTPSASVSAAAVSAASASAIPPPPPLPPSKTSYFSRFVTQPLTAYGSRPPSAQTNRPDGGRPNPLVPRLPGIRTGLSHDVSHKTGLDISALDINRDRTHAILAGKEILKTVRVHDARIVEDTNLRAAVINAAEHTTSHARQREGLTIHDVKWSHGQFNTHIATAAANGKVILYDLNRAGVELARLHEHTRQVHKIAFNPHQGHLLLSASHDATVRLWDLRDMKKDIMTCPSRDQFAGINGGIRDVQWSPTDAVDFAFGTDNGTIQRWDFRHNKGPKQKITAHDQRICTSIDWHPDGKHLLSAGVDRTVKVWDFSVEGRRQKPAFVLTTPYPVYKARWRPPYWSDEYYEKGVYQCTQLATSYDRDHSMIHVWDFRRPYLPFREINKFPSAPSDMLWHSRDTLWSVGREGVFQQNDVHLAPKVVDRRNLQAFAISPSGEVGGFAQRRGRRRRRSGLDYSTEDTYPGEKRSSPEKNSLRSSADDSLDDSFLSSSLKRHHGRTASNRSAKSFVSTPPSEAAPKVMFLTDSMAIHNESIKPNQIAFRGTLPGAMNLQIFSYLAQKYKAIPLPDPPTLQSFNDLQQIFEQNAEYAQRAAFYRMAETWRVLGVSAAVATRRRAELHRQQRLMQYQSTALESPRSGPKPSSAPLTAHDQPSGPPPPQNPAVRALATPDKPQSQLGTTQPAPANESTSNLPTPLARPVTTPASDSNHTTHLPDPEHDEQIRLPPAATGPHSFAKENTLHPESAHRALAPDQPTFTGPHWYQSPNDYDERRALVGSWRAPPRAPLSLEPTNAQGLNIQIPPRLDRHDSDESFAMFSASTDSQRAASMPSSYASGKSQSQSMESIPEKWPRSPAEPKSGGPRPAALDDLPDQQRSGSFDLGKSVQISPTTVPIGNSGLRTEIPSGRSGLQGSARGGTGQSVECSSQEKAVQDIENLRRNNQLLRHDSSESEAYASSRADTSSSSMGYSMEMEASGTIVPDFHEEIRSPPSQKPPAAFHHETESAPPVVGASAEDPLLLSDYQAMRVDAEESSAFSVIGILNSVLAFNTNTMSDAQMSSLLILLLTPLLPQKYTQPGCTDLDPAEVLSNFSDAFAALGLTPTQAQTVLSTQIVDLLATGINPYQAEAILHSYHSQLHTFALFNSAASLRRISYPTYPAVYEQALKDTQLGLLCLSCSSPINNPKDKMRCETCKRAQAPCPICWGRYPAFEPITSKKKAKTKIRSSLKDREHKRKRSSLMSTNAADQTVMSVEDLSPSEPERPTPPKATLWTWCPLCGHGGHTDCLSTWFAAPLLSDGACATEGCLCDCVQGKRRDHKIDEALAKKAEKDRAKVVRKGDDWRVTESKAVSAVRGTFGEAGATSKEAPQNVATAGGSGFLPLARRDEGRRVRVVAPHGDQQPTTSSNHLLPHNPYPAGRMPK